jgi:hypothetical protein
LFNIYTPFRTSMSEITQDPLRFGVGARITLSVMSDQYVSIILGALANIDKDGLDVQTGDVSTYIGGDEASILRYLTDLSSSIASSKAHSSITIHLFRGCPGAIITPSIPSAPPGPRQSDIPKGRVVNQYAAAEWALYPLADTNTNVGTDGIDHMRDIYAAIDYSVENGTFRKSEKSVTRLEGDLGVILETVVGGWVRVGGSVQHVASHVTISLNSPSHGRGEGA